MKLLHQDARFCLERRRAVAAVAAARVLPVTPAFASLKSDARSAYKFTVLPDPLSVLPPERQEIPVTIYRLGETRYVQLENSYCATSYIVTDHVPRTRLADQIRIDLNEGEGFFASKPSDIPITRASPASYSELVDGKIVFAKPGEARIEKGGIRVEPQATNLLLYSNEAWRYQAHTLRPGNYVLSWYGSGQMRVEGEAVALRRPPNAYFREVRFLGRRLSNNELMELTK